MSENDDKPLFADPEPAKPDTASLQSIQALRKAAGNSAGPEPGPAPASQQEGKKIDFDFEMALAVSFQMMGEVMARRYGDHWKFEETECEKLGLAWAAYLNSVFKIEESPLAIALGLTAVTVTPRAAITIVQLKRAAQESNQDKPDNGNQSESAAE